MHDERAQGCCSGRTLMLTLLESLELIEKGIGSPLYAMLCRYISM